MRNDLIKTRLGLFIVISVLTFNAVADDDGELFDRWSKSNKAGVSAVQFQQYNEVCGSCHFPYQPGLLPAVSWEKVMTRLDDHFGQPLALTPVETRTMMRYVLDNSAGHVNDEISNKILQSLKYNPVPIRITQTPYWKYVHKKIENTETKSPAYQCDQCHQEAAQGRYDSHKLDQSSYSAGHTPSVDLKM